MALLWDSSGSTVVRSAALFTFLYTSRQLREKLSKYLKSMISLQNNYPPGIVRALHQGTGVEYSNVDCCES